jgi:hypothetical protein
METPRSKQKTISQMKRKPYCMQATRTATCLLYNSLSYLFQFYSSSVAVISHSDNFAIHAK